MAQNHSQQIMEAFWDYHADGHFNEATEQIISYGYEKELVSFVFTPENYHYPEIIDQSIVNSLPPKTHETPVVALEPGVEYFTISVSLHPYQTIALRGLGFSNEDIGSVDESFKMRQAARLRTAGNGVGTASVHHALGKSERSADEAIDSRPIVVLNVDRHLSDPSEFASVVLHELVHVTQSLDNPVRKLGNKKEAMKNELEAYAAQAKLISNYTVPYSLSSAMAGEVERFRKLYLPSNEFMPDDHFMEAAVHDPILRKVVGSLK